MMLGGKYSRGKDLKEEVVWKKVDSELWKNLVRIWPRVISNLYWEVGNGKGIRFWFDKWLDHDKKLIELCSSQLTEIDEKLIVIDVVTENGKWDMTRIKGLVNEEGRRFIMVVPPPSEHKGNDTSNGGPG
ncbi:hypothetical protein K1719_000171 [Acacia pycnantha]|nr:hypothetical protein K1719_000171 [Acacia pycnantha]